MESSPTTATIRQILLNLFLSLEPADLIDDQPLSDQVGLDSIGIIQLCIELEKTFGIHLDGHYLDPKYYESVESIAELVERVKV
jgi:acyl carrier protein